MNEYRQKLLESYCLMLTTQFAFARIAIEICLLDELKDLAIYKDDGDMEFSRDILKTMKDPVILKIGQLLDDLDVDIHQLDDNSHFLDEELDSTDMLPLPGNAEKFDRIMFLKMLVVYFRHQVAKKLEKNIDKLCKMCNEIPIDDYNDLDNCDDPNIKAVASFLAKCIDFDEYLSENKFNV